jgi:hypothetical protein
VIFLYLFVFGWVNVYCYSIIIVKKEYGKCC